MLSNIDYFYIGYLTQLKKKNKRMDLANNSYGMLLIQQ